MGGVTQDVDSGVKLHACTQIEEEYRTLLLDIEDRAVRCLRLKLSAAAAEQALRVYRDRRRSSMIERENLSFATTSRGAYLRVKLFR